MSKSYKIVVIGAGGVGKSCFTIQLISGTYVETYDPTLEDSYRKQMTVDHEESVLNILTSIAMIQPDKKTLELIVRSAVRDQYIRIGEGFICMYSITNEPSFKEVTSLREKIANITEQEDHPVVLVGNKCDLESDRQVKRDQGEALAKQYGWKFLEGSAKSRINVAEAFVEIVRSIRQYRAGAETSASDSENHAQSGSLSKPKGRRRNGLCLML